MPPSWDHPGCLDFPGICSSSRGVWNQQVLHWISLAVHLTPWSQVSQDLHLQYLDKRWSAYRGTWAMKAERQQCPKHLVTPDTNKTDVLTRAGNASSIAEDFQCCPVRGSFGHQGMERNPVLRRQEKSWQRHSPSKPKEVWKTGTVYKCLSICPKWTTQPLWKGLYSFLVFRPNSGDLCANQEGKYFCYFYKSRVESSTHASIFYLTNTYIAFSACTVLLSDLSKY